MRMGMGWVGPLLRRSFDLQSRPRCALTGLWEKALPWKWNTRDTDSCCAALCWAEGLVTHRHELVIRNVSSHEEVSGSGLLHCVSFFLVLFTGYSGTGAPACRVVPPCFVLGTELSLCVQACVCAWHWIECVHACTCLCVCVFYLLLAQRLYPTKPWPRVSCVCMGDNALHKLAVKPGLVQVLCHCVREKQVGRGLDWLTEIYFHLWRTWPVAMWLPFLLLSLPPSLVCHLSLSLPLPPSPHSAYSDEGLDNKMCPSHIWQSELNERHCQWLVSRGHPPIKTELSEGCTVRSKKKKSAHDFALISKSI